VEVVVSTIRIDLLASPFFAAAGLLVVSGVAKLRHPEPAGRALAMLNLPSGRRTVGAIAVAELVVGAWCLFAPNTAAAASLGLLYAAFAAFLVLQLRAKTPGTSCGCLGSHDASPSLVHVTLDLAAAMTAAVVATAPQRGVVAFSATLSVGGVPFLVGTALIAYLAYLVAAFLPKAFWSYDRSAADPEHAARARGFALRRLEDR
jgi:methylamine utilization protein MauE